MKKNKVGVFAMVMVVGAVMSAAWGRSISGMGAVHLTAPVTKEYSDKAYDLASKNFITDCIEWLKEETGTTVDTANAVWNYHLSAFAAECLRIARQESSFREHNFGITITLSSEEAHATLKQYNAHCQALSLQTWTLLKKLLENNGNVNVFQLGIQAIFYSMGRLEKTLDVPGAEEPGSFLVQDARKIMQDFIDKIALRSPSFMISGKPGSEAEQPLVFNVSRDSTPLTDFAIFGWIPPGKKLFSGSTGPDGSLSVPHFKIPFVHKGTFLYVEPDFAAAVRNVCLFTASDLGLQFPAQTLLFNTVSPTFSVSYSVGAASDVKIPKDFGADVYVKKYLRDSCFLTPAENGEKPDLQFKIISQVSSSSSDSTEMTTYKVVNAVTITGSAGQTIAEKTGLVLEKSYETNTNYSLPLFYWEASGKSFAMVKAMLGDL